MFWSRCPCCPFCETCDDPPLVWEVVIGAVPDGDCDCTGYGDTTYSLDFYTADASLCLWRSVGVFATKCAGGAIPDHRVLFTLNHTGLYAGLWGAPGKVAVSVWKQAITPGGTIVGQATYAIDPLEFDCLSETVLPFHVASDYVDDACVWPATIIVRPA